MAGVQDKIQVYVGGGFYYSDRFVPVNGKNISLYNTDIPLLGVVGETVRGPAFKPIFITDYIDGNGNKYTAQDVFNSVFGDTNDYETYNATNDLRYELALIANRYLEASNQLFVTRVLGLSGYDAGKAWGIKVKVNLDKTTEYTGNTVNYNPLFNFTATTSGQILELVSSDSLFQYYYDLGLLDDRLNGLGNASLGSLNFGDTFYNQIGDSFTGLSVTNWRLISKSNFNISSSSLSTLTFNSNQTNITIPDIGVASSYPITFDVSGLTNNIVNISLTLSGFTHPNMIDVGMVLVSPSNLFYTPIFSRSLSGGFNNKTIIFSSDATEVFSFSSSNDVFLNNPLVTNNVYFNSPTPTLYKNAVYSNIKTFIGLGPTLSNGTWKLYIQDFSGTSSGSLSNAVLKIKSMAPIKTFVSGQTSGSTTQLTGFNYLDSRDTIVAILRSRGRYVDSLLNFEISGGSSTIGFDTSLGTTLNKIDDPFQITGVTNGVFDKNTNFSSGFFNIFNIVDFLGNKPFFEKSYDNEKKLKIPIYVSEYYPNMLKSLINEGKIHSLDLSLVEYGDYFKNYKQSYRKPESPWIVSQVFGSNIYRLFKCLSLHDGDYGNNQVKITITNIDLIKYTFDLIVRNIDDSDDSLLIIEKFENCSMNPISDGFIGRKIGTYNGDYPQQSSYITLEISDDYDYNNSVPAGFLGYPIKDYETTVSGVASNPKIKYKNTYTTTNSIKTVNDDKDKVSLGFTKYQSVITNEIVDNFDLDMFKHIGMTNTTLDYSWTGLTDGFHLDSLVNSATLDNYKVYYGNNQYYTPKIKFTTGPEPFTDEETLTSTQLNNYYEKRHRKFTFVLYGGFDGWDIYREQRTFADEYQYGKELGDLGYTYGYFNKYSSNNAKYSITSDYYAFLDGIATFKNPEETPINLFATPGIDMFKNTNLVEYAIDLAEDVRQDILYLPTIPDTDNGKDRLLVDDVIDTINNEFDTTYAAIYWPWIKGVYYRENFVPPTCEVVRLMAEAGDLFDVVAGTKLGELGINNEKIVVRPVLNRNLQNLMDNGIFYKEKTKLPEYLTKEEINLLYANRINPLNTIETGDDYGVYLWGNKTLQNIYTERNLIPIEVLKNQSYIPTGRSRISIRRLLLYLKVLVTKRVKKYLFEQNDNVNKNKIQIELESLMKELVNKNAISTYSIKIDDLTATIDSYTLTGKIYLKPYNSLEFVEFLFDVTDTKQNIG